MSVFNKLRDKCKKQYVSRKELWDLTGGIIRGSTISQLDSMGRGIESRTVVCGKTMYSIDSLIEWLENNAKRIK